MNESNTSLALAVGGDITTLLRPQGNVLDLTFGGLDVDSTFSRFFYYMYSEIVFGINANKCLVLPSTTLADYCYSEMFANHYFTKNFTGSGVDFSAITDVKESSCNTMFENSCADIKLSSTTLTFGSVAADGCRRMFNGYNKILDISLVKFTKIEREGAYAMLSGVEFEDYLPSVEVKNLAGQGSMAYMFYGCENNDLAPDSYINVGGLGPWACREMYAGCSDVTLPVLPKITTKLAEVNGMPALNDNVFCSMYDSCSNIRDISELDFTIYDNYLTGSAGASEDSAQSGLFQYMFSNCYNLTTIPGRLSNSEWLPAGFYKRMFNNCSSLNTLAKLPAVELGDNCYKEMFYNCSNIKMSETLSEDYPYIFEFGIAPEAIQSNNMFAGTGGSFVGTPEVKILYTANGKAATKFRGLTLSWNLDNEANSRIDIQLRGVGIRTLPGKVEYSYDAET